MFRATKVAAPARSSIRRMAEWPTRVAALSAVPAIGLDAAYPELNLDGYRTDKEIHHVSTTAGGIAALVPSQQVPDQGLTADELVLVESDSIPRTSSGRIAHRTALTACLDDTLLRLPTDGS